MKKIGAQRATSSGKTFWILSMFGTRYIKVDHKLFYRLPENPEKLLPNGFLSMLDN